MNEQMDKCAVTAEEERPLSPGGTGFSKVHTVESRGYVKSVVSVSPGSVYPTLWGTV